MREVYFEQLAEHNRITRQKMQLEECIREIWESLFKSTLLIYVVKVAERLIDVNLTNAVRTLKPPVFTDYNHGREIEKKLIIN